MPTTTPEAIPPDVSVFLKSPALRSRSPRYPERFGGKVPRQIRMQGTVRPNAAGSFGLGRAERGQTYFAWTNVHGAVSAVLPGGVLGLEPDEFEIVAWAQDEDFGRVASSSPANAILRESLGQRVRAVWIAWAKEQPNPKPSWLVPWEGLSEPDKEVDRRIGEELYRLGQSSMAPVIPSASEGTST